MLRADPLTKSDREGKGSQASLLVASGFSLVLHGAALACFYWLGEAAPAQPMKVIAVDLVGPLDTANRADGEAVKPPGSSAMEHLPITPTKAVPALELPRGKGEVFRTAKTTSTAGVRTEPARAAKPAEVSPPSLMRTSIEPAPADQETTDPLNIVSFAGRAVAHQPPPSSAPLLPRPRPKPIVPDRMATPEPAEALVPTGDVRGVENIRAFPEPNEANHDPPTAKGQHLEEPSRTPGEIATAALAPAESGQVGNGEGGDIGSEPRFAAQGLANPAPRYPYMARRRGQEGRVILRVQVNAAGHAEAVSIWQSSGYRVLDDAALDAVRKWRFIPAHRAGKPVSGLVEVPVAFKLTN